MKYLVTTNGIPLRRMSSWTHAHAPQPNTLLSIPFRGRNKHLISLVDMRYAAELLRELAVVRYLAFPI